MSIKATIGGDRLGSGNKMQVSMHGYGRSNHNLSRAWRSSMAPGVLVPCFVEPILAGDTWDIDLDTMVRTLPTNGPLFGKFKMQIDFFKADIRLYNRMLHNNLNDIGMDMKSVLMPLINVEGLFKSITMNDGNEDYNHMNISPDSLLSYIGINGLGNVAGQGYVGLISRKFNAIPFFAVWEIYNNYYANKQEGVGYVITSNITESKTSEIQTAWYFGNGAPTPGKESLTRLAAITINTTIGDRLTFTGENLTTETILLQGTNKTGSTTPTVRTVASYDFDVIIDTPTHIEVIVTNASTIKTINSTTSTAAAQTSATPVVVPTSLKLQQFPLKNIETMRNNVFVHEDSSPLIIGKTAALPYQASLGVWLKSTEEKAPRSVSSWTMAGLPIKTYNSDRFNNWIKTDWIDGPNGVAAISAVPIVDGKFTIDSLNLMQKVYNLLNRIALKGGTYQNWLETTTGLKLTYNSEIPVFVGGMSSTIDFSEVISTAETTTGPTDSNTHNPLGTLAGRGYDKGNQKTGKIIVKAKEHGFLIGIVSITPEIDYSQGNKWFNNITNMDQFHKPELSQIGYQELITDEMAAWDTRVDPTTGNLTYKSAGKQPAWIQYMTAVNETHGKFAIKNSEMFMTLNRQYELDKTRTTVAIGDLTTYIDPTKYNYAFAQSDLSAQNFWVQIGIHATARRIMSAKSIPNL